jgi:hypothetical protein
MKRSRESCGVSSLARSIDHVTGNSSRIEHADEQALVSEALRVYRRYAVEIVEGYGLCPWAERARQEGRVIERVIIAGGRELAEALSSIDDLAGEPRIEVALLILPMLALDARRFEHFVSALRDRDAGRHPLGKAPFAMAAFHPDAEAALDDAERLIPFLRRTPDPTVQLVRLSVLERIHTRAPQGTSFVDVHSLDALEALGVDARLEPSSHAELPLRERIARANLSTVTRVGVHEIEAKLRDIQSDRDAAYARCRSLAV